MSNLAKTSSFKHQAPESSLPESRKRWITEVGNKILNDGTKTNWSLCSTDLLIIEC